MPGAAFASSWQAHAAPGVRAWRAAPAAPQRHSSVFLPDLATVSSTASCDTSPVTITFCVGRSTSTFCTPARPALPFLQTWSGPAGRRPRSARLQARPLPCSHTRAGPGAPRTPATVALCLPRAACDRLQTGCPVSQEQACLLACTSKVGRLPARAATQQSAHLACFSTRGARHLRSLHTSCRPSAPQSGPMDAVSRWTGDDTPRCAESARSPVTQTG